MLPLIFLHTLVYAQLRYGEPAPLTHHRVWTASGTDSTLTLEHAWLLPETFSIRRPGQTGAVLQGYRLEWKRSLLIFEQPPDSGSQWIIRYQYRPFHLLRLYAYATLDTSVGRIKTDSTVSMRYRPMGEERRPVLGSDELLEKSGSVFRGVSLGTGGMRLQSGLQMQLSGTLAPGVEISAALTDQSTPIQPEGNTQALQEIDKVFVNIKMKHAQATLGDLVFEARDFGMGAYSRKLQGIQAGASWDNGQVSVMAAAGKGQFKSQHFLGLEGVQGPYQLTGTQGQREIIVLAGTERVYVDGRQLTRGEENAYTIDYANGQILFTRKQLITGDSRITVDFEFSDQKFQKNVLGATGEFRLLNDRLRLKTSLLRESDDKDNPLDLSLNETYRHILSAAGDSLDQAAVSGAQDVGEGKGSYIREQSGDQIVYTYVGSGLGDHVVRFSYVGQGRGDYAFQGYGIYIYKGQQQGDYLPIFYLPVAQSQQLAVVQADMQISSTLSVQGEAGLSQQDLNLYSGRDDRDNNDHALSAQWTLKPTALGPGKLSAKGKWRDVGERFRFAGRAVEVEHGRRWGTAEGRDWGERSWEAQARYAYSPKIFFDFERGALNRLDDFTANRQMMAFSLQPARFPLFFGRDERVNTTTAGREGLFHQQEGRIQGTLSRVELQAGYRSEHKKDADADSLWTGNRFEDFSARLAFKIPNFRAALDMEQRQYSQYVSGVLSPHSTARTQKLNIDWKHRRGISGNLLFTRRRREYDSGQTPVQSSDLAESRWKFQPRNRGIELRLNYRYASNKASEMVRDTIEVAQGLGNYRYDEHLDELLPDSDGNLLVRQIQTGRFLPVNHLQMSGELRARGGRFWKKGPFSKLNLRSTLRVERRDKERDFLRVNHRAFSPRWNADTTMVSGLLQQQHDLEYRPAKGAVHLRLRYQKNDTETHQLLNEGQYRNRQLWALRMRTVAAKTWSMEATVHLRRDDRDYESVLRTDRAIRETGGELKLTRRLHRTLELGLDVEVNRAVDRIPNPETVATALFVTPRLRWRLGRKGQLRAEWALGRIVADPKQQVLPYEMFDGDQPGSTQRWSTYLSYRLNSFVQATLSYRGRNEPWRAQLYQTGQIEVRAFF